IDDISFKQICTVADSVYMNVINVVPSINTKIKLGCTQDTVVFTSVNNGTPPDRHKWDFGDGNVDTSSNPTHIYTTQGQYSIKLYESRNGCADSAFTTIDTR